MIFLWISAHSCHETNKIDQSFCYYFVNVLTLSVQQSMNTIYTIEVNDTILNVLIIRMLFLGLMHDVKWYVLGCNSTSIAIPINFVTVWIYLPIESNICGSTTSTRELFSATRIVINYLTIKSLCDWPIWGTSHIWVINRTAEIKQIQHSF